ncbi:hypothetical protein ACFSHQ_22055 [Gemmobacter lanyuensis]
MVKHLLAPLAPVPRPSLGFLKVVPEALRFVEPSFGTGWLDLLDLRGLRSLCWRCARLGVASRLGVLAARAARCAARASRCAACSAARFAPASTRSRLSACHAASQAGVSASVVIAARPRCLWRGARPKTLGVPPPQAVEQHGHVGAAQLARFHLGHALGSEGFRATVERCNR